MQDRIETLTRLTGVTVRHYKKNGVNYFQFMRSKRTLRTVCTYRKARLFADGILMGKELAALDK